MLGIYWRSLYVFVLALVSLAVSGCDQSPAEITASKNETHSNETMESTKNNAVRPVSYIQPIQQDASTEEELEVASWVTCRIPTYYRAGAFVKYVVPDGTWVEKGDRLIEFDSFQYLSELVECRLRLAQAQADLEQAKLDLQIAKAALETKRNEMQSRVSELQTLVKNHHEEEAQAQAKLDAYDGWKRDVDEDYKFAHESSEKLESLKLKVRAAEDKLIDAKNPNEQEKLANMELSKARRELEDFGSQTNSETERRKRRAEALYGHFELVQQNRLYPTKQFRRQLEIAVATATRNADLANVKLRAYEQITKRANELELSATVKVADAGLASFTFKVRTLSHRLEELEDILERHAVSAPVSGQVRYTEGIELGVGVECRNGQSLMSLMQFPSVKNAGDRGGHDSTAGGEGGFDVNRVIDMTMERYDTNSDGKIDGDEQKDFDVRAARMTAADKDGDGVITREEVKAYMEVMMKRFRQGGGGDGRPKDR